MLLRNLSLDFLSNVLAKGAVTVVPEDGVATCCHYDSEEAINNPVCILLVLLGPLLLTELAQSQGGANIEREEVLVDGLEIGKDLLDLVDDIVDIILGESLNPAIAHSVREVCDMAKKKLLAL